MVAELRKPFARMLMPLFLDRMRPHWAERRFLRSLLSRLEVDVVLDVGANVGQYAEELRLIGYRGFIVSFEPDPTCFAELARKAAGDPRWEAVNVALGSAPGEATFNIMANRHFNSFRAPSIASTDTFAGVNRVVAAIQVRVDTLGRVFEELKAKHKFERPYLKMDTQGFDLEVFIGARDILPDIVGMQSELSVKSIYEGSPDWRTAIGVYESQGFELAGLYSVDPWSNELVEFDCFLIRPERAGSN